MGWTVWGSNPGVGEDFPHPFKPTLGAHPASYIMGTGSLPGVKRLGRCGDHSPPSSADVKGRVEL